MGLCDCAQRSYVVPVAINKFFWLAEAAFEIGILFNCQLDLQSAQRIYLHGTVRPPHPWSNVYPSPVRVRRLLQLRGKSSWCFRDILLCTHDEQLLAVFLSHPL